MNAAGVSPEDIHSIDDLHKLPFTVKDDLRNTYPLALFAVPKRRIGTNSCIFRYYRKTNRCRLYQK